MFTIRFHGRGGQGIKTAARLLGKAFFLEGFEVQDAPRYGAERRGAPMSAYVRADRKPIFARGIILYPGLIVVTDDTLVSVPTAGVLAGITGTTVLLMASHEQEAVWRKRLDIKCPILIIPHKNSPARETAITSVACIGAAASLIGTIGRESLIAAIRDELSDFEHNLLNLNLQVALENYDQMKNFKQLVKETHSVSINGYRKPAWIELPLEPSRLASPTIRKAQTSSLVQTGLWRTQRPIINYEHCHKCWWICSNFCPDSAITVNKEGFPVIDYDHCKGCMICATQCPSRAIETIPEAEAKHREQQGE